MLRTKRTSIDDELKDKHASKEEEENAQYHEEKAEEDCIKR